MDQPVDALNATCRPNIPVCPDKYLVLLSRYYYEMPSMALDKDTGEKVQQRGL
jgi:hypothetical protein